MSDVSRSYHFTGMDDSLQMVPTKGSQLTKKHYNFQAVVFSNRRKSDSASNEKREVNSNTDLEFDIRKATKEVIKLGIKGFHQRRRDRTLKSIAIDLGAKPEKNRYHNYKDLKIIRKKNQERREEHKKASLESHNTSAINRYKKSKKRRSKSDINILNKYGKRK